MTNEYELADESREKLIFEKEDLLAPLRAGMIMPPHPMYPEMDENNYYRGEVTSAHPSQAISAHNTNQIVKDSGEVK
jgi:NADH-quinone oxidoreductase subunit I